MPIFKVIFKSQKMTAEDEEDVRKYMAYKTEGVEVEKVEEVKA